MNKKVVIFSHESDIDGLGSIILGKIAFKKLDYVLSPNVDTLEVKFRSMLENNKLDEYDNIYITDLMLHKPAIDIVDNDLILSKKVKIFDHHKSSISEGYDDYSFTTIIEEDTKKRCATDIFYEYLVSNGLINRKPILDEFAELTRLEDTWDWKKEGSIGVKAHDLAILLSSIGIEEYINKMYMKLLKDESINLEEEKEIIENKKQEYLETLKNIWDDAEYFIDEYGNSFASLFANYEYRNEISEYASSHSEKEIKYLIIVALDKGDYGQKSYRRIDNNFDVSKIAETHGGGGHASASAVNITKEQSKHVLVLRKKNIRKALEYIINSSYSKEE